MAAMTPDRIPQQVWGVFILRAIGAMAVRSFLQHMDQNGSLGGMLGETESRRGYLQ